MNDQIGETTDVTDDAAYVTDMEFLIISIAGLTAPHTVMFVRNITIRGLRKMTDHVTRKPSKVLILAGT